MKTCFVVNYWADTNDKVDMVCTLLSQLKVTNIDLVYTSLTPINENINKLVKYSLYHKDNDLISLFDILNHKDIVVYNTDSYDPGNGNLFYSVPLNYREVSFSVFKQLLLNLRYLKNLGYTHFHFMVGDCSISENEIRYFDIISESCKLLNKKSYFEDLSGRFDGYGAVYFYSEIDFFINHLPIVNTKFEYLEQYSNDDVLPSFETVLKNKFMNDHNYLLLGNNNDNNFGPIVFFKESKIDIISTYHTRKTKFYIIPSVDKKTIDFYCVINDNKNYKVTINNVLIYDLINEDNFWFLHSLDNKPFKLQIECDGVKLIDELINDKMLDKLTNNISFYA